MFFHDRTQAGEMLAADLQGYKNAKDTVVLGLPRGGVVTAAVVASALHLPLDITCPRKIGAPFNPEFAIGAVTETGSAIFNRDVISRLGIPEEYLKHEVVKETKNAQQRLSVFRRKMGKRVLEDKTVILIDDGLATGSTMEAAIESVKNEGASRVVVAVPVSPPDTLDKMRTLADEVVCLFAPSNFYAVGQFYERFDQVEDDEVLEILERKQK